jgi:hypothetical protein
MCNCLTSQKLFNDKKASKEIGGDSYPLCTQCDVGMKQVEHINMILKFNENNVKNTGGIFECYVYIAS